MWYFFTGGSGIEAMVELVERIQPYKSGDYCPLTPKGPQNPTDITEVRTTEANIPRIFHINILTIFAFVKRELK